MKIRKLIALFMAMLLGLSVFTGCSDKTGTQTEDTVDNTTTPEEGNDGMSEYYIIRPELCSSEVTELAKRLRNYLTELTGATVTLYADATAYEAAEGRFYILLGDTAYQLSADAKAGENEISYLASEDSIAICASSDTLLNIALEKFIADCSGDSALDIKQFYRKGRTNASECLREGWQMAFPAYATGKLDEKLYSCGYAVSQSNDCSYMHVVNDTDVNEYKSYLQFLDAYGYACEYSHEIDGNLFAQYSGRLGNKLYVYYVKALNKVRIIEDAVSVSLSEFCYSAESSGNGAEFYMYRINEGSNSEDTFLIHLSDNSWIFVDGGVCCYNDIDPNGSFADELYAFMREKSGLAANEKLVISCWYMTHPHRDHFLAFSAMISRYYSKIELQRILANTPDTAVVTDGNYTQYEKCMSAVATYYPDVLYLKAHAGMQVELCDVKIDILATQEDNIETWVSKDTTLGTTMLDMNNSSILSKFYIGDMTVLMLGDGFRADAMLAPYYDIDTLACDVLKVAHHYYNFNSNDFYKALYATGKLQYCLVTRDESYKNSGQDAYLKSQMGDKLIYANYSTIYKLKSVGGAISVEKTVK